MKKKALCLLLACAMTFSLAACGSNGKDAPAADSTEADSDATGDDAAAGDDAETPAASDGAVFKIGGIGPTTGGASIYGIAVQRGMEIAVEEINAAGGINGVQIELNFQDDEHDPEKSVNAYNTLKDWGMQVLVGSVTSNPCIAVVEKSHEDNIFQLTPSGTAEKCVQ